MISPTTWKKHISAAAMAAVMASAGISGAATISVTPVAVPSASVNDFTVIRDAVGAAAASDVVELNGTFNWAETNALASYSASLFTTGGRAQTGIRTPLPANITIRGLAGTKIQSAPAPSSTTSWTAFTSDGRVVANGNGLTIEGIEFSGFERTLFLYGPVANLTIQNNKFYQTAYTTDGSRAIAHNTVTFTNEKIINNQFYLAANGGAIVAPENTPDKFIYGILTNAGTRAPGGQYTGNTFNAWIDPSQNGGLLPDNPSFVKTTELYSIFENSNSNSAGFNLNLGNNTFNGAVNAGGTDYKLLDFCYIYTTRSAPTLGPSGYGAPTVTYNNNVFNKVRIAYYPFNFTPETASDYIVVNGNTFNDCGDTPGWPAILNGSSSVYGEPGPIKIVFDLATNVNGQTGINALHEMAADPDFFEKLDGGSSGLLPFGIEGAIVYPDVADEANSAWTGLGKFTAPPGRPDIAIGYNGIGDVTTPNPNKFLNDNGITVPGTYTITLTGDTAVDPGTLIPTGYNVTVKSDVGNKWALYPSQQIYTSLFILQGTASVTFEDVVLSGDAPAFVAPADILNSVSYATSANGSATFRGVTFTNFVANGLKTSTGTTTTVEDSEFLFTPLGTGILQKSGSTLSVSGTIFDTLSTGIVLEGGAGPISIKQNLFAETDANIFVISAPNTLTIGGAPGEGNYFFNGGKVSFNPGATVGYFDPATGTPYARTLNFSYNWHGDIFGYAANDASGRVVGNVDVNSDGSSVLYDDVQGGVYGYGFDSDTFNRFPETNIVSQFDRDVDGLPDAVELNGVTAYNDIDSDDDGVPDGAEVTLGSNPNNPGSTPAGFVINADLNSDRYADWYVDALQAQRLRFTENTTLFLGDVTGNQAVQLSDAVRALQIVNSALPFTSASGNLNAINVTGQAPNQIANPLAILRYQAGVRNLFPAIAGID